MEYQKLMRRRLLPLALGLASILTTPACDKHYHNNTTINNPGPGGPNPDPNNPNPNNPDPNNPGTGGPGPGQFSFTLIPQQEVDEGSTLTVNLDQFMSNRNVALEVSGGPGSIAPSGNILHQFSYTNPVDPDPINNTYLISLTARPLSGQPVFEPVSRTFTILQRDNDPR